MAVRFHIIPNTYRDSVSLMQIAAKLKQIDGVLNASMSMATPANLSLLTETGHDLSSVLAGPNDLLIMVDAEGSVIDAAIAEATNLLSAKSKTDQSEISFPITTIAMGQKEAEASIAVISVPGDYAVAETLKALNLGLNVMLFSDNISGADEKMLKTHATKLGKIVMGPDCGTAILDGIPLAFANVVRSGSIGLVAASGTGLQEVTVLIDRFGGGITQAIGTGGHDLSVEVGGLSMLFGLEALANDPETKVITLISKPPAKDVMEKILQKAREINKPVVINFLGADPKDISGGNIIGAATLEDAAIASLKCVNQSVNLASFHADEVKAYAAKLQKTQKNIRALYSGGTFCFEATLLMQEKLSPVFSNTKVGKAEGLSDLWHAEGHTLIDLGDDAFTRGRPHPMIDPTLRKERILQEAADPSVGVILLDLVLGYGAHMNPAAEIAPTITKAKELAKADGREIQFVMHICGTENDPQNLAEQEQAMVAAGVILADTNVKAVELAVAIVQSI